MIGMYQRSKNKSMHTNTNQVHRHVIWDTAILLWSVTKLSMPACLPTIPQMLIVCIVCMYLCMYVCMYATGYQTTKALSFKSRPWQKAYDTKNQIHLHQSSYNTVPLPLLLSIHSYRHGLFPYFSSVFCAAHKLIVSCISCSILSRDLPALYPQSVCSAALSCYASFASLYP